MQYGYKTLRGRAAAAALAAFLMISSACGRERPDPAPPSDAPQPPSSSQEPQPVPEPEPQPEAPARGPSDYIPAVPDAREKLQQRKALNADTVAWLYIPDSGVDEPVFQTYDNEFYLFNDEDKQYRRSGSLFVDYECWLADGDGRKFSQNTIIYGHNLGNPLGVRDDPQGERFAKLLQFTDQGFADAHPYIFLTTDAGVQVYEIFSAAYIDAQPEPVEYIYPEYPDVAFSRLVDDLRARSLYQYKTAVGSGDKLLILSCCSHKYGPEKENPYERFIVAARLAPREGPFYETASLAGNPQSREPDLEKYTSQELVNERIRALQWRSLTQDQMFEDWQAAFGALKDNFPYYDALFDNPEDPLDVPRADFQSLQSDAEFYLALTRALPKYSPASPYIEHNPWEFPDISAAIRGKAVKTADPFFQKLAQVYGDSRVVGQYEGFSPFYGTVVNFNSIKTQIAAQATRYQNPGAQVARRVKPNIFTLGEQGAASALAATANIQAKILREGQAAYIRIRELDEKYLEEDKAYLFDFYRHTGSFKHLIIDVMGAKGESREYVRQLLAAPLLPAAARIEYDELMMDGEVNRGFFDFSNGGWRALTQPEIQELSGQGLHRLRWSRTVWETIEPPGQGRLVKSNCWLLADGSGGFAADYAAYVMRTAGLAAIVGETTSTRGLGMEPAAVAMPNSGFILRYMPGFVRTPDGAHALLEGVAPDFPTAPDQSALETCLSKMKLSMP